MLARRTTLTHPSAGEMELPLLVPAFSSKGFDFKETRKGTNRRDYSMVAYELEDFARFPSRSVLISAYDLHFKHMRAPKMRAKRTEDYLRNAALVFLDSGGYELSVDFDLTECKSFIYRPKDGFGEAEYETVLHQLTHLAEPMPLVITNFDHSAKGKPLSEQIAAARTLFNRFQGTLSDFIIKPWKGRGGGVVDPSKMTDDDFGNLRGFDIIGITEKDLGRNLLDRLRSVAVFRRKLSDAGVTAPIHVWGGLDPITTPLYFFAGAEIFDGISWLRYAFRNGVAINRASYSVLTEAGVGAPRQLNHMYANVDNLTAMRNQEDALQQWVDFGGTVFDMFHPSVKEDLAKAYKVMCSKIKTLKGG